MCPRNDCKNELQSPHATQSLSQTLHRPPPPKPRLHLSLRNQHKPTVSNKYPAFFVLEKKSRAALLTRGWFLIWVVKSSLGREATFAAKQSADWISQSLSSFSPHSNIFMVFALKPVFRQPTCVITARQVLDNPSPGAVFPPTLIYPIFQTCFESWPLLDLKILNYQKKKSI